MSIHTKYDIATRCRKIKFLAPIFEDVGAERVYVLDTWAHSYTGRVTLVTAELALALKLNNYDNVKVILASASKITRLLKQEWVREYFSKQLPAFVIADVISMIEGGEPPTDAWEHVVSAWIPENKSAHYMLQFQEEEEGNG